MISPELSVIIPVYNRENYIDQCLSSIVTQTLRNIEIICIDDGSQDNSLNILKNWAAKDTRIVLISQEHQGVSAARNAGIKKARAPLLAFVDADDTVYSRAYEIAVKNMTENIDWVCFGIEVVQDINNTRIIKKEDYYEVKYKGEVIPSEDVLLRMDYSPCNKIFRKSILEKNQIHYPVNLHYEDAYFCSIYGLYCRAIVFLQDKFYFYLRHTGSTMDKTFQKQGRLSEEHLYIAFLVYQYLKEHNLFLLHKHYFGELFFAFTNFALQYADQNDLNRIYNEACSFLEKENISFTEFPRLNHAQQLLKKRMWQTKIKKFFGLLRIYNSKDEYKVSLLGIPLITRKYKDPPRISVLMPVYNSAKYLKESIDSILAQTWQDFEFIIINDGSTDNTAEIVKSYKDSRIIFVDKKHQGLVACLNNGLDMARGEYIARMDADDISMPNRLAAQLTFMEKHPKVGILGSWFYIFGNIRPRIEKKKKYPSLKDMLETSPVGHPTVMLRKAVFQQFALRYNPAYEYAEDYELWMRASAVTKIANLQTVLLKYRWTGENVSNVHEKEQSQHSLVIKQKINKQLGNKCSLCSCQINDTVLLSVLKSLKNFSYMPNSGNMGDMLIASATMRWFEQHHLNYQRIQKNEFPEAFVYGGGGAWIKMWISAMSPVLEIMKKAKRIVILPSSFDQVPELIEILDERFIVFCREKKSFDYLSQQHTKAKIILDHDMALRLDAAAYKDLKAPTKELKKRSINLEKKVQKLSKKVRLFRLDNESLGLYNTDLDLSDELGWFGWNESRKNIDFAAHTLLKTVRCFDLIQTDRLHVGIAAALTGADVELYDNSYGKVSGVYMQSLQNLANVKFQSGGER